MITLRSAWSQRGVYGLVGGLLWLAGAAPVRAGEVGVSEEIQVPILLKLLTYDRTLMSDPPERIEIAVVYARGSGPSLRNRDAVLRSLASHHEKTISGIPFRVHSLAFESAGRLVEDLRREQIHVVYVTAGHEDNFDAIRHATQEVGALSITGAAGFVARGLSVGVEVSNDKPRIQVNLGSLKAERHELKSSVLRLCDIVGGRP